MKQFFPGLEATESEQILVRVIYLWIGWPYIVWADGWHELYEVVMAVQVSAMVVHTLHARWRPHQTVIRRHAGVFIDLLPCLIVIAYGTPTLAPLFFVMSTISVGYGLRFGPHYTLICALVTGVGLGLITTFMPAFRAEWGWMLSTIALVSIVPLYSAYLTVRLSERRRAAETEAARFHYLSTHDQLTGLVNRSHLLDVLEQRLHERVGRRPGLAVLFVDLDGFKSVNDRFGHQAGDTLLRHIATCMRGSVRSSDIVARVGGDEFVVLIDEVLHEDEVPVIVNALEERVRMAVLDTDEYRGAGVSIGVAIYTGQLPCPTAESLIAEADAAMYKVKSVHHANVGGRSGISPAMNETNKVATLATVSNEASMVRSRSD